LPDFNDLKPLYKYLLTQIIPQQMEKIGEEVKDYLKNLLLTRWYKTYNPTHYSRTNMLIDSITLRPVKITGDTVEVEIYFDENKITPVPASQDGYFPSHSNITDGADSWGGQSYGELLVDWIENGQSSSIYSASGVYMVRDTIDYIETDNLLMKRMKTLLQAKGYTVV
jgi:hypothetical protein